MLSDRCRLWLTVNSMENIPSIDNRSLYADTLNSLYNNVYNLKNIRIQELSNVYDRDYNQLKNLLFNKYLKIIRDSEAGLADLIINDLNNSYQSQVVDTFNVYTMYGGADEASTSRAKAPSRGKPSSKMPEMISSGPPSLLPTPSSFPPPPPPPPAPFSKADYDKLKAMSEDKLSISQLLDLRNYEIKTIPVAYTVKSTNTSTIKLGEPIQSSRETHKDVLIKALNARRRATMLRSTSRIRLNSNEMPELIDAGTITLSPTSANKLKALPTGPSVIISFKDLADKIKKNILITRQNNIKYVQEELESLNNDIILYLTNTNVNRESDNRLLQNRLNILKENKLPIWRYNYEMANNLLRTVKPPYNIENMPKPVFDKYAVLLNRISEFNVAVLKDNSFENANLKLF